MWKELSAKWQTAFEEAWTAFRLGNIPIGAAVFDRSGNLLVREHNRTSEPDQINRKIAHAETNALRRLNSETCDLKSVVLYTTMEPCPMCMGTAVMSNIRHLRYAARDPYCGCADRMSELPYIRSKSEDYRHTGGEPELVQLVLQSYYELKRTGQGSCNPILEKFREINSQAVMTAAALLKHQTLDAFAADNTDFSFIYDEILRFAKDSGI
ncbi:MAG: nucleoside deaminase [Oscillospiraceae bacterium]|nr:nucleoside deaminase [Oscillospiraceae bacterium]